MQELALTLKNLCYFLKRTTYLVESKVTFKPNELEDRLQKKTVKSLYQFFWLTPNSNLDYMSSGGRHNQERIAK